MRKWLNDARVIDSSLSTRETFRLAATGTNFSVSDFDLAKKLHASFLQRIGTKEFTDLNLYRQAVGARRTVLSRLLLPMSQTHVFHGTNAPVALTNACNSAFGKVESRYHLPFGVSAAVIGAYEHFARGIQVGEFLVRPVFGVFAPSRPVYCDMLSRALGGQKGRWALDVGTGTGALALILSRHFDYVVGTDVLDRAVLCARDNIVSNGVRNVEVVKADLFPVAPERFDCIVFNPPWIPLGPLSEVDIAIFDKNGATLKRFLSAAGSRLAPGGRVYLILSNLAELCGLRSAMQDLEGWKVDVVDQYPLAAKEKQKGLVLVQKQKEVITVYELTR